jgi:hypothetical protein
MDEIKKRLAGFLILICSSCAHQAHVAEFHCEGQTLHLPKQNISGAQEKFNTHTGPQKFDNYISLSLEYGPFENLFQDLSRKISGLKNRGEAHVTVITPIEYDEILRSRLTIVELNTLAQNLNLQNSQLKAICVGKGEKKAVGQTYFVVLESQELLDFRRAVQKSFLIKGGLPGQFDPDHFYPHVTIGFSLRDLHESDGVIKGKNSCYSKLSFDH